MSTALIIYALTQNVIDAVGLPSAHGGHGAAVLIKAAAILLALGPIIAAIMWLVQ